MRNITHIVLHCAATPAGREVTVKEIDTWHRQRGFAKIGYHYVIHLDGRVSTGRPESEVGAHVSGHNANSIGICYVGGVAKDNVNKPQDTRTPQQIEAMARLVRTLLEKYPKATVLGHRDFPGVAKACPSFEAIGWWKAQSSAPAPSAKPNPTAGTYEVAKGDTLYGIAAKLGVDVFKLALANGRVTTQLALGEGLTLPPKSPLF